MRVMNYTVLDVLSVYVLYTKNLEVSDQSDVSQHSKS